MQFRSVGLELLLTLRQVLFLDELAHQVAIGNYQVRVCEFDQLQAYMTFKEQSCGIASAIYSSLEMCEHWGQLLKTAVEMRANTQAVLVSIQPHAKALSEFFSAKVQTQSVAIATAPWESFSIVAQDLH
eukprot:5141162-Pyramimonas_sp.AAC.2